MKSQRERREKVKQKHFEHLPLHHPAASPPVLNTYLYCIVLHQAKGLINTTHIKINININININSPFYLITQLTYLMSDSLQEHVAVSGKVNSKSQNGNVETAEDTSTPTTTRRSPRQRQPVNSYQREYEWGETIRLTKIPKMMKTVTVATCPERISENFDSSVKEKGHDIPAAAICVLVGDNSRLLGNGTHKDPKAAVTSPVQGACSHADNNNMVATGDGGSRRRTRTEAKKCAKTDGVSSSNDNSVAPSGSECEKKEEKPQKRRDKAETLTGFDEIEALPEAPPLPPFPDTGHCEWSFDAECRVLLAKFNIGDQKPTLTPVDESFLLIMMERTDIAVVSEGLFDGFDPSVWDLNFISSRAGDKMFHRFRHFESVVMSLADLGAKRLGVERKGTEHDDDDSKPPTSHCIEKDGIISMTIGDYVRYLHQWEKVEQGRSKGEEDDHTFKFRTANGVGTLDVRKDYIYLNDCDLKTLLPETFDDFHKNFLAPDLLPGGKYCMTNSVSSFLISSCAC